MEKGCKDVQTENYKLRQWAHQLQTCLINANIEVPAPPQDLNLSAGPPPGEVAPTDAAPREVSGTALEAVAQAVADLAAAGEGQFSKTDSNEDARTAEEISRQLQAENVPAQQMPATIPMQQ